MRRQRAEPSSTSDAISNASNAAGAPSIETFTSDAGGFDTHSFWIDTGTEVVVFDAQFTEWLARDLVAEIRKRTESPITWVVIHAPQPG